MKNKSKKYFLVAFLLLNGVMSGSMLISYRAGAQPLNDEILFIIPPRFNFQEYDIPRTLFEEWGYSLTFSMLGETEQVYNDDYVLSSNITIQEIENVSVYDCIYVVGSMSWVEFGKNDSVQEILITADEEEILITAICSSVYVLGCAGIIEGRNVSGLDSLRLFYAEQGATFINEPVVSDGHIITADYGYWTELSEITHEYLNPESENQRISGYTLEFAIGISIISSMFISRNLIKNKLKKLKTT